jgi:hypothetical protein
MRIKSEATMMKHIWISLFMAVLLLGLAGCSWQDDTENPNDLSFENASTHMVQVVSLTAEWGSFTLAPGEKVVLHNIKNVDYYFNKAKDVKVGSASTTRNVIFVDAIPPGDP